MGSGELGRTQREVWMCVLRHLESSPCTWPSESPTKLPCPWWISSSRMGENLPACLSGSSHLPPLPRSSPTVFPPLLFLFSPLTLTPLPVCSPPSSLTTLPSGHLDAKAADGNSAVHYAALHNQPDCLKLLLKGRASVSTGEAQSPPL